MADTLPDITLSEGFNDLYALTGIIEGTPLLIKSKTTSTVLIVVGPQALSSDFYGGWDIAPSGWVSVTTVPTGSRVWAKGYGRLMVQVDE